MVRNNIMTNDNIPHHRCDYGCGREAKHYFKYSKRYCCETNVSKCPYVKKISGEKGSISRKGIPTWNKGLTKETSLSVMKISKSKTGKPNSPESNEKNRISNTGKKMPPRTEEWRENQRQYMLNGGSKLASSFITPEIIKENKEKVRKTRESNGQWIKSKELSDFYLYQKRVWFFTNISAKEKFTKEELKQRGQKKELGHKQLDHIFSVHEGFNLGILPSIIGCKSNINLVDCSYNLLKDSKCDITLEELFQKYIEEIKNG